MRPRNSLVVVAVGLMLACTASAGTTSVGQIDSVAGSLKRLRPPPDRQAYFGFTFRLWESTDPAVGDSRPFDQRIQDSIQNELAGKTPTFLNVWAGWQDHANDGSQLLPFSNWNSWISEVRGITGRHSLLYLDWTLTAATRRAAGPRPRTTPRAPWTITSASTRPQGLRRPRADPAFRPRVQTAAGGTARVR